MRKSSRKNVVMYSAEIGARQICFNSMLNFGALVNFVCKSVSPIFGSYSRTFLMFANTNFESLYVGLVISLSK